MLKISGKHCSIRYEIARFEGQSKVARRCNPNNRARASEDSSELAAGNAVLADLRAARGKGCGVGVGGGNIPARH